VDLDGDAGLASLVDDLEGKVLDVILDGLVGELLSDETFLPQLASACAGCRGGAAYDVEDGAVGVAGVLVLGGVSDETLVVGEGDPGWCDTVTWRRLLAQTWCGGLEHAYLGR
jgi:hypothetical protein